VTPSVAVPGDTDPSDATADIDGPKLHANKSQLQKMSQLCCIAT